MIPILQKHRFFSSALLILLLLLIAISINTVRMQSSQLQVATLKPEEMVALGRYFEKMGVPVEPAKDLELASVGRYVYHFGNKFSGVPACASCHGKEGLGTSNLPRLAGQYANYIESQLRSFGTRERTNDNAVMHSIVAKMTPQEMAAVAEYLSGK